MILWIISLDKPQECCFFFFFLMKVNLNKKLGNLWYVSESVSHSCSCSCSVVSNSLWPRGLQPARPFCPWNCPGKKYWSGLPFTPQGNLPHPGIKPASPASSASPSLASRFLTLSHLYAFISRSVTFNSATPQTVAPLPGSSVHGFLHIRMLEWVAIPFRGSSWPRDWTWVSCLAGRFFTRDATRKAHLVT